MIPQEKKIRNTFSKGERLCSKKTLETLFTKGKYISVFPLKLVYIEISSDTEFPVQTVISVSKRNFKKAVSRNLLKRRIREAYRKNKHVLFDYCNNKNTELAIGFIYSSPEVIDYFEIEKKLVLLLQRLIEAHEKSS